ncbi:serine/threonine-protein phosphatase 2A activator isoform X2 [Drosophila teissieri]|uniref:serine/threonine-protein phosphatase 2A activator isoform X2 n=1 Tax=Drosophila teissieri TaxID=7243 RepID=UPI001CBA1076|nr:serine/threonine-protein phosphatase 2A activator isoform X2 [Drosophila teissieri]
MEQQSEVNPKRVAAFFRRSNLGPVCRVQSTSDIEAWLASRAYFTLITYLNNVSTEIQGIRNTDWFPISQNIRRLTAIFDKLDSMIVANPPAPVVLGATLDPGNKGYRRWAHSMLRDIYQLVEKAVPCSKCRHVNELGVYLSGSFGSSTKIEYGTGHELSFLFFMCALFKAEILNQEEDLAASALVLFDRYMQFVRRLQKMLNEDTIAQYRKAYMLINCVGHMAATNIGTFARHSSQLWSLAALSSWSKIHRSLMFMYMEEILLDVDNLNALRFGEMMSFEKDKSGLHLGNARMGVRSPLRRYIAEDQDDQDQDQDVTSRSDTPSISRSEHNEYARKKPRVEEPFSDGMSNSGLSPGSECSSLSGVSVHLATWLDDCQGTSKKAF